MHILFIVRIEYSGDLIQSHIVGAQIGQQQDAEDDAPTLLRVRGQATLQARERSLESTHTPFRCLPQRDIETVAGEQLISQYRRQVSSLSARQRPDKLVVQRT
mmetsp:Transcript_22597/g.50256  ORF Transcript_22597/g.50256 Transcript_22597/m.50256 type:complete len:103 (-) Transcript_22597:552-860(-)